MMYTLIIYVGLVSLCLGVCISWIGCVKYYSKKQKDFIESTLNALGEIESKHMLSSYYTSYGKKN